MNNGQQLNNETNDVKKDAFALLNLLYTDYRSAEKYLYLSITILLGFIAYVWKDFNFNEIDSFKYVLCISFSLIFGINLIIGLIYVWWISSWLSILKYETKLNWLQIRPTIYVLFLFNKKNVSFYLLGHLLIPFASGLIGSSFYAMKFVMPIISITHNPILISVGIFFSLAILFISLIIGFRITLIFHKYVLDVLMPRNLEGQG